MSTPFYKKCGVWVCNGGGGVQYTEECIRGELLCDRRTGVGGALGNQRVAGVGPRVAVVRGEHTDGRARRTASVSHGPDKGELLGNGDRRELDAVGVDGVDSEKLVFAGNENVVVVGAVVCDVLVDGFGREPCGVEEELVHCERSESSEGTSE